MADNQEMLEWAAIAGGIDLTGEGRSDLYDKSAYLKYSWNPLEDDGDLYRLAKHCNFEIDFLNCEVTGVGVAGLGGMTIGWKKTDPEGAARAIVQLAATHGRYLK